jgi:hypothetical protein
MSIGVGRVDIPDRVLVQSGGPIFGPIRGRGDVGMLLAADSDWDEIAELLVASYRLRAPKRLVAHLTAARRPSGERR